MQAIVQCVYTQDVFTGNKVTFNFNSVIERLQKLKQTI